MVSYNEVANRAFDKTLEAKKMLPTNEEGLKQFIAMFLDNVGNQASGKDGWILSNAFNGLADVMSDGDTSDYYNADFNDIHCTK